MTTEPTPLRLPALDPVTLEARTGTGYPEPFRAAVANRERRALGTALGLRNFGVNLTTLSPGAASAQRHWHAKQDEFIYVVAGEVTLITDAGEQVLTAGMVAGFPAGRADGHHLVNRSDHDAVILEVGDRTPGDVATYPDIDLEARDVGGRWGFFHKDGTPYY
ncbi:MAG: cupin domain-containing protein [Alphaproteobacteria bacterium]|nr:MAG: cupin domain-containing protein [Alphaproteobacteria bacterium]